MSSPRPKMTVIEQIRKKLSNHMMAQREILISGAISRFFGNDDWNLCDLVGRLENIITPDSVEIFHIDGQPIIEFYPLKIDSPIYQTINVTQNYRML